MRIESTSFGDITIDGRTYDHDVVIRLDGDIEKRKKEVVQEALRDLAYSLEGRGEVRV